MTAPDYTAQDFTQSLLGLMPRGLVWNPDIQGVQAETLALCAPTIQRVWNRATNLLVDAFPSTTYELLAEWENTLGLPDSCTGQLPTIQQRVQAVVAKLLAGGGQSVAYFISIAATLGLTISIQQYAPSRVGVMKMGDPLMGEAWAFHWQVTVFGQQTTYYFRMGQSVMGEALQTWATTPIECMFRKLMPAHTTVSFEYVNDFLSDDEGNVLLTGDGSILSIG